MGEQCAVIVLVGLAVVVQLSRLLGQARRTHRLLDDIACMVLDVRNERRER